MAFVTVRALILAHGQSCVPSVGLEAGASAADLSRADWVDDDALAEGCGQPPMSMTRQSRRLSPDVRWRVDVRKVSDKVVGQCLSGASQYQRTLLSFGTNRAQFCEPVSRGIPRYIQIADESVIHQSVSGIPGVSENDWQARASPFGLVEQAQCANPSFMFCELACTALGASVKVLRSPNRVNGEW